eukprot:gene6783-7309_t
MFSVHIIGLLFLSYCSLLSSFSVFPRIHQHRGFRLQADKIRIRLSSDVSGVGKKGDIAFVSPAYFTNSLLPKRLAVKLSDEDITRMESKEKSQIELVKTIAKNVNSKDIFYIKHKMGPNGQLFGSISLKDAENEILTQLYRVEERAKELKGVAVTEIFECDEKAVVKGAKVNDLRKKGIYIAMLKLHPKVPPSEVYLNLVSDS